MTTHRLSEPAPSKLGPKGKLDQTEQDYQDGCRQKHHRHIAEDAKYGAENPKNA